MERGSERKSLVREGRRKGRGRERVTKGDYRTSKIREWGGKGGREVGQGEGGEGETIESVKVREREGRKGGKRGGT